MVQNILDLNSKTRKSLNTEFQMENQRLQEFLLKMDKNELFLKIEDQLFRNENA